MKRILCFLPLIALAACDGKKEDRSKVLAKIAGTSYTQSDFEFMIKTMSPERQEEIKNDPDAKRKQFNQMLKTKLQALAAEKSKFGKSKSLADRQVLIDKRIVTQSYFQTHLGENNGFTVAELEAFHNANPSKFSDDSGKVLPFGTVRSRVADSLVVAKAPLDSFFKANDRRYEEKEYCDISIIQVGNRKTAEEASKAIAGGMSFPDAAAKFSTHEASKAKNGKLGRLKRGEPLWELGTELNFDSAFFNEDTRLKVGAVSKPLKKDTSYLLVRSDSCAPKSIPPFETVRHRVGADYLAQFKTKLSENALAVLKAKYGVKMASENVGSSVQELRKYYEANKEAYFSPETYEVYHLESKNKDLLAKRIKGIKDLEGFKAAAGQISENSWTKPGMGHIGVIKRDHSLPFGIGMMPALFPALDTLSAGLVSEPIQNPDTKKWHAFWLAAKFPRREKPFERVQALVRQDFKSEKTNVVNPQDTVAIYAKGKILRQSDIDFLREEIPPHMQERYTREALADYLLTWDLATLESQSLGLLEDAKLKSQREENRLNYWVQIYQDSIIAKTAGLDSATLLKTFQANRVYFTKDSSEKDYRKFVRDIGAFLTLDSKDFEIEYRTYPERYRRDTVAMTFDEARFDVFQNLKGIAMARAEENQLKRLEKEFQVVMMDPALLPPKIKSPQDAYKQAQNLHYDRKLDLALEHYQRLRNEYPKSESLQDSICFGMAQIYIEQEKYQQAMAEYRRLSFLYPKSPNNYKAMFMVGFIHAEHLKNDSAAVRSFEKMLAQYPSSDLSDDADWMIRNIRSGGKLMPVLEGDADYVPDSAGTATDTNASPADSASDSAKVAKPAK